MRYRLFLLGLLVLITTFAAGGTALADETRRIGTYELDAGYRQTPVYTEEMNALVLTVRDSRGQPVDALEGTLTVEIATLGRNQTLEVRPAKDQPGRYEAVFVPPSSGEYTFDVRGSLNGTSLNERFTTGNGLPNVISRNGYDYSSPGAYFAYFMLVVYLVGLVVIAVVQYLRRDRQKVARAGS